MLSTKANKKLCQRQALLLWKQQCDMLLQAQGRSASATGEAAEVSMHAMSCPLIHFPLQHNCLIGCIPVELWLCILWLRTLNSRRHSLGDQSLSSLTLLSTERSAHRYRSPCVL